MALGMTMNGANGATYDSMQNVLGFDGLSDSAINQSYQGLITSLSALDPTVAFDIANSIWYRQGFSVESDFVSVNQKYFNAVVNPLNFNDPNAASTINAWVNQATNGKIPTIVTPPISPLAVMFLINAIYFKGTWTYQFDSTKTVLEPFAVPGTGSKNVPMMNQERNFLYYQNAALQMVDLPYGNGDYRMTVVLPAAGTDIDAFVASMNPTQWSSWIDGLDSAKVKLSLPRFTLQCNFDLKDPLSTMGMSIAFSFLTADFTRISDIPGLYISAVKHKTYIKVGEEGTEAAAVTSVEIVAETVLPPDGSVTMDVNHPFIFAIRDAVSGTLIFVGKVINPS